MVTRVSSSSLSLHGNRPLYHPLPPSLCLSPCLSLSLQLHYLRLPKDISEDHVILMDSTVSTGAAAMMAVRVLLVRHVATAHLLYKHHCP